jgi:hypothetical protein
MWNEKKLMEWNGNGMKVVESLWNGMIGNCYGMEMEFKFSRFWITNLYNKEQIRASVCPSLHSNCGHFRTESITYS